MRRHAKIPWFIWLFVVFIGSVPLCLLKTDYLSAPFVKTTTLSPKATLALAPFKHVTKSLLQLGSMDELNKHVLLFNRVPKCGSEMLVLLLQWLQGWNNFKHIRMRSNKKRKLNRLQQENFVYEIHDVIRNEAVPLSFDADVYFINFTSFDRQSPTYINLIRDPADKIVSRYYSKTDKGKVNSNISPENSFEMCFRKRRKECILKNGNSNDLAVPYFCGHEEQCRKLNDKFALDKAKANVERYFSVVGVLEELNATLEAFETKIPYFFKGVQNLYYKDLLGPFRNKNKKHYHASDETRKFLRRLLVNEYEFYEWIRTRLFKQLQITYRGHNFH